MRTQSGKVPPHNARGLGQTGIGRDYAGIISAKLSILRLFIFSRPCLAANYFTPLYGHIAAIFANITKSDRSPEEGLWAFFFGGGEGTRLH